jgi:two-component system nitrogen regulation sensor histidine kinase GlnL
MTPPPNLGGLELLATAVALLDGELRLRYLNPAAEQLFEVSGRSVRGQPFTRFFVDAEELAGKLKLASEEDWGFWDQNCVLTPVGRTPLHLNVLASPIDSGDARLLLEIRRIEQRLRAEREEQLASVQEASRELVRNLAHEVKNPLGGLRGSAQLLERELTDRPDLREYTQVIIKEADRLQLLMDRLLTPHRPPHIGAVNIHEVCERVRSLILAEFPEGFRLERDYDSSLPELSGDREQLIQVVLNIVRNAAQSIVATPAAGRGPAPKIVLRTRVARQVTLARRRHRLALELSIIDNGPGIPDSIRDRIFNPLVSGRDGGTGLGLTLAQTYVQRHRGAIECASEPGHTVFRILLPTGANGGNKQ